MNKRILRKYAKLIAAKGINVQKGQDCILVCDVEQAEFAEILVDEFYKLGARRVIVDWDDQKIAKLHYEHCSLETLSGFEKWELEKQEWKATALPAICYIISEDPDGLSGINQDKFAEATAARRRTLKPYRDRMESKYQWCIAAAAGKDWAKKVFPCDSQSEAVKKLWVAILKAARAEGDPIRNWENHNETLKRRYEYLNAQHFKALKYSSSNGTDLTVGLIDGGRFAGGAEKTLSGVWFNPNVPSEEIFTSPKAGEAEGIVYSTKPLSYDGQLIENFSVRFEKGRAVEVKAEKNQALLEKIIKMDEGAAMLGECALVAFDSPINNTGILFFETLFDENACCHLALGEGFSECLEGYESMTLEERRQRGLNKSIIHVDFMIGTDDLKIEGVKADGSTILIFVNGNWAF